SHSATQPTERLTTQPTTRQVTNPALRDELLRRRDEDQAIRRQLIELMKAAPPGESLGPGAMPVVLQMKMTDAANRAWLRGVLDETGWPGKSMVGEEAASAAWLIVQHADDDVDFQEHALAMLTAARDAGEADAKSVAYLVDRVRMNRGQPQVYGTQTQQVDGEINVWPIEDAANVDERRAAVELMPLADYLAIVRKEYRGAVPATSQPATQPTTKPATSPAAAPTTQASSPTDPALRAELLRRYERDQELRRIVNEDMQPMPGGGVRLGPAGAKANREMRVSDAENREWLRDVIATRGWPAISEVGKDGSKAAWIIAQHSDADVDFQELALQHLQAAVEAGKAHPRHAAYLTDRVRVHRGLPQIYGTQGSYNEAGELVIENLEDPDNVNARRAEVGLGTLEDYLADLRDDG
ncbi:MAG: DUF6624 domain-containing protein, partial [Planctomycetota bacterium]